jgi:hypothetical protein
LSKTRDAGREMDGCNANRNDGGSEGGNDACVDDGGREVDETKDVAGDAVGRGDRVRLRSVSRCQCCCRLCQKCRRRERRDRQRRVCPEKCDWVVQPPRRWRHLTLSLRPSSATNKKKQCRSRTRAASCVVAHPRNANPRDLPARVSRITFMFCGRHDTLKNRHAVRAPCASAPDYR